MAKKLMNTHASGAGYTFVASMFLFNVAMGTIMTITGGFPTNFLFLPLLAFRRSQRQQLISGFHRMRRLRYRRLFIEINTLMSDESRRLNMALLTRYVEHETIGFRYLEHTLRETYPDVTYLEMGFPTIADQNGLPAIIFRATLWFRTDSDAVAFRLINSDDLHFVNSVD